MYRRNTIDVLLSCGSIRKIKIRKYCPYTCRKLISRRLKIDLNMLSVWTHCLLHGWSLSNEDPPSIGWTANHWLSQPQTSPNHQESINNDMQQDLAYKSPIHPNKSLHLCHPWHVGCRTSVTDSMGLKVLLVPPLKIVIFAWRRKSWPHYEKRRAWKFRIGI